MARAIREGQERRREGVEEEEEEKKRKGMDHYVFVTLSMEKYVLYGLYGSVCMELGLCMEAMMILYGKYGN